MRMTITASLLAIMLGGDWSCLGLGDVAAQVSTPVRYTATHFYQTRSYSTGGNQGNAFSHDNKAILVSSDESGTFNAYWLPVDGGPAVQLTRSKANAIHAVSSIPRDGRILVSSDAGGPGLRHLYIRSIDGVLTDITPGDGLKADFLGWHRDGSTFFIATNERDPLAFDVYAYDAVTLRRRLVFKNDGGFQPGAISADGSTLALLKKLSAANSALYVARLAADGPPKLITPHNGNVTYQLSSFGPAANTLVYLSDEDGEWTRAYTYDLASGRRRGLADGNWDVTFSVYSPSGRYRVTAMNIDAATTLTIVDTRTGRPLALSGVPAGDVQSMHFSADERSVAFTVASDTSPRDVFVADTATGKARRLTTALNPAIREDDLVEAGAVRISADDGVSVPGLLYKPEGASPTAKVPAVVLVHGGPGGQSRREYSATIQHLVNHGYAVLAPNNRGSSGYGKTFSHMDDKRHGEADLQDIVASGKWLRKQGWVSPGKVAVMGTAYGGYLTVAALTFHPDAFAAGVDIFGVTNWQRTLKSIPAASVAERTRAFDEMGDPETDEARHRRISPLFYADRITKPLLIMQGGHDPNALTAESDAIVAALRKNNVSVGYLVFPDEGHGFTSLANRIAAQDALLRFLDLHVRDRP